MTDKITLYSTGCECCKVLKSKLDDKSISYTENNSVDNMIALGIKTVPVLNVNGVMYEFKDAIKWVNKQ